MTRKSVPSDAVQFGFDALLTEADSVNRRAAFERECGHLPVNMGEAIPYYRSLIDRHHHAMLAADLDAAMTLRAEAERLATRLNNGEPGICAGPDAPGSVMEARTAAEDGVIPKWGQRGNFVVEVGDMRVQIEMDGLFGIGARFMTWMNFYARALDWDHPFLSETGYHSFMGLHAPLVPGLTPDMFAAKIIAVHVSRTLKGRLLPIAPEHRPQTR